MAHDGTIFVTRITPFTCRWGSVKRKALQHQSISIRIVVPSPRPVCYRCTARNIIYIYIRLIHTESCTMDDWIFRKSAYRSLSSRIPEGKFNLLSDLSHTKRKTFQRLTKKKKYNIKYRIGKNISNEKIYHNFWW